MRNKILTILVVTLLGVPAVATAELIQFGAANILTFRQCTSGETTCDSFGPMLFSTWGGIPGELLSEVSQADVAYGEAYGSATLTEEPGAAEMKAITVSLPATRNGSTSVILQRYTNASESAETLTFEAELSYKQTVPAENAGFPEDAHMGSGASAELVIFTMDVDAIETGTTAEELYGALSFEQEPAGLKDLDAARVEPSSNETGEGTSTLSATTIVEPGDSVWLWAILQGLVVNGATVNASLETTLDR
jgi:hypothetical protein